MIRTERPIGPIRPARTTTGLLLTAATVVSTVAVGSPAANAAAEKPAAPLVPVATTVVAHRGDRAAAPENTLAAIAGAIRKRADAIELDVRFSRSGYPVVIHDAGLRRTTDCQGLVSSKNVRQLHRCDAGSWFGRAFAGEQIPTLWDALKLIRKQSATTKVVLHMKVEPTRREARKTMHRVRMHSMLDRTIVMASSPETMARMKHAGAKKRAFIFNSKEGWDHKYKIMVPYDVAIAKDEVAAATRRGAVVWAVQYHPLNVTSLLRLANPVQGILVNQLNPRLLAAIDGVAGGLTSPLWRASSIDDELVGEQVRPAAVGGAEDEMTARRDR